MNFKNHENSGHVYQIILKTCGVNGFSKSLNFMFFLSKKYVALINFLNCQDLSVFKPKINM